MPAGQRRADRAMKARFRRELRAPDGPRAIIAAEFPLRDVLLKETRPSDIADQALDMWLWEQGMVGRR